MSILRKSNLFVILWAAIFGVFFLCLFCSCSTFETVKYATGYESTARTLLKIHDEGRDKCSKGEFTAEQCQRLKDYYNEARTHYLRAGDDLIKAIDSVDRYEREAALEEYTKHSNELSESTVKLIRYYDILLGGNL